MPPKKDNPAVITAHLETTLPDAFALRAFDAMAWPSEQYFRLSYNQVILVTKGSGIIRIDEVDFAMRSGSLILVGKNQVIAFSAHGDLTGYSLAFGDCFWEKTPQSANNCKAVLFNAISSHQHVQLPRNNFNELSRLFKEVQLQYQGIDYINKADALAAFLKIIIIKIANIHALLNAATSQQDHQLYSDFLNLLEQQFEVSHDVGFFASQLHISPRKLTAVCHKYAAKGAKDLIKLHLIAEAKKSLQFSSSSIKEIAFKLNFSPYQFSHFFKKHTSLPPEHYRRQFAEIDN